MGVLVQSTKYVVGIIIAVICSNWIGEVIHSGGVYEVDLEADGSIIFLRATPPPALFAKTAGDIACKAVWYATPFASLKHSASSHLFRLQQHCLKIIGILHLCC